MCAFGRHHVGMTGTSSPEMPSPDEIVSRAAASIFNKPLVTNVFRALVAEAIVDAALGPMWSWCAGDYSSWDFIHEDGTRLEVKQSAARQTWATATSKPSSASFDIAERTGSWEGPTWVPGAGRKAHIYVFAHHPIPDETADHRDPAQWQFYTVGTEVLPLQKRIALGSLQRLCLASDFAGLSNHVERLRADREA